MKRELATPPLEADAFEIHKREVRDGIEIAYLHEGVGGLPLLLLHGWPGTKRLWWRNVQPLAEAGFEVIVPDARGFGDSTVPAPEQRPDLAVVSRDVEALLSALGHSSCAVVAGDAGSGVAQDMALRFPGLVQHQVLFNGPSPHLPAEYERAGIPGSQAHEIAEVSSHLDVHGLEADRLVAELDSEEQRLAYVEGFYTGRAWKPGAEPRSLAGQGHFDAAAAAFHASPFGDAGSFRASLALYEAGRNRELRTEPPRLTEINEAVPTLILYGVEDQIIGPRYTQRMEVAHRLHTGPFLVEDSGHFLQWERADVLNGAIVAFCRELV